MVRLITNVTVTQTTRVVERVKMGKLTQLSTPQRPQEVFESVNPLTCALRVLSHLKFFFFILEYKPDKTHGIKFSKAFVPLPWIADYRNGLIFSGCLDWMTLTGVFLFFLQGRWWRVIDSPHCFPTTNSLGNTSLMSSFFVLSKRFLCCGFDLGKKWYLFFEKIWCDEIVKPPTRASLIPYPMISWILPCSAKVGLRLSVDNDMKQWINKYKSTIMKRTE